MCGSDTNKDDDGGAGVGIESKTTKKATTALCCAVLRCVPPRWEVQPPHSVTVVDVNCILTHTALIRPQGQWVAQQVVANNPKTEFKQQ